MEQVFLEKIRNKKIFCYFSEPLVTQKKIVIMSHGFKGTSTGPSRAFVDFQRLLNTEGYSVLRFDEPNSGNSDGDYIDTSFTEWVDTIVYFVQKYINQGYVVSLLGQSMGATATVVATSTAELKNKIPCILLWVPDPKTDIKVDMNEIYEETGQLYKGIFWEEVKTADFFKCLEEYNGSIHLVYGEYDKYVHEDLKIKTIDIVKNKKQPLMILKGKNHSSWKYEVTQEVYKQELLLLNILTSS